MIKVNKQELQKRYVDLNQIATITAKAASKEAKRTIKPSKMMLLYLSSNGDAFVFCELQYKYFVKKGHPENTPIYVYYDDFKKSELSGDTLGSIEDAVNNYNKQGFNFILYSDLESK